MSVKKNESIAKQRKLFLNIGLIITLSLVITAFEWRFYNHEMVACDMDEPYIDTAVYIRTVQKPPPPPPPPPVPPQPTDDPEVDDDTASYTFATIDDPITAINAPIINTAPPEPLDPPLDIPSQNAEPDIGMDNFRRNVAQQVSNGISERDRSWMHGKYKIFVEFVVEKDGSVSNVSILKGASSSVDAAAVRSVENSGKWKPARDKGVRVRHRIRMPIRLILE